jgi:DNA invertase Pin-like site-specific DNA recombinase
LERVDIYTRLSDEDRNKLYKTDDSESIQNQKTMLVNYCVMKGWDIHRIYCDDDYGGCDRNRPEFNRMIDDCRNRLVDIVLCKSQSRFSRDMEIVERYIHEKFTEWGVRFVGIVDNADTNVVGNKKARQINGLVNRLVHE